MRKRYQISGRQIAAGRVLAGLAQSELAAAANVSVTALRRMEEGVGPLRGLMNDISAVRSALDAAGIEFIAENAKTPCERLKKSEFSAYGPILVGGG
ncbi:MAG: helix-turn-helix domain-containing protein [Mesorhizobium sp.]|nr:MAG: helix-turn-helix domain-containing protein [Mesorhizobium sp.]